MDLSLRYYQVNISITAFREGTESEGDETWAGIRQNKYIQSQIPAIYVRKFTWMSFPVTLLPWEVEVVVT